MRAKKDGEFVNVKVERILAERLNQYVAVTGFSKTVVVEKALRMFFDRAPTDGDAQHMAAEQVL